MSADAMAPSDDPAGTTAASGPRWLHALGLHRRELRAWALYDWANSAFVTTIVTAVFPIFYVSVAAADLPEVEATQRFAFTTSVALALVALLTPVLGAVADYLGAKKRLLGTFLALGVVATVTLFFISQGAWLFASLVFVLGNVGFSSANVFYNSLLPHIAREDEIDRVSTAGYALGYLGGGYCWRSTWPGFWPPARLAWPTRRWPLASALSASPSGGRDFRFRSSGAYTNRRGNWNRMRLPA